MNAYDRMLLEESLEWNEAYDEECTNGAIIEDTLDEIGSSELNNLIDELGLDIISIKCIGDLDEEDFEIYSATGIF